MKDRANSTNFSKTQLRNAVSMLTYTGLLNIPGHGCYQKSHLTIEVKQSKENCNNTLK